MLLLEYPFLRSMTDIFPITELLLWISTRHCFLVVTRRPHGLISWFGRDVRCYEFLAAQAWIPSKALVQLHRCDLGKKFWALNHWKASDHYVVRSWLQFCSQADLGKSDNHGSRPGRKCTDALLEKLLIYEHACLTRTSLITVDNDAKSCYDRFIKTLAMTACMAVGLPFAAAIMHNITHHSMKHRINLVMVCFQPILE
jgi:hypothetical protein